MVTRCQVYADGVVIAEVPAHQMMSGKHFFTWLDVPRGATDANEFDTHEYRLQVAAMTSTMNEGPNSEATYISIKESEKMY